MTEEEPPSLEVLLETRTRLRSDMMENLTSRHREFLVSLADANPDWTLLTHPEVQTLPALRWKLENLTRFKKNQAQKSASQVAALKDLLFAAKDDG